MWCEVTILSNIIYFLSNTLIGTLPQGFLVETARELYRQPEPGVVCTAVGTRVYGPCDFLCGFARLYINEGPLNLSPCQMIHTVLNNC